MGYSRTRRLRSITSFVVPSNRRILDLFLGRFTSFIRERSNKGRLLPLFSILSSSSELMEDAEESSGTPRFVIMHQTFQ